MGTLNLIRMIEGGDVSVKNLYKEAVTVRGNEAALGFINELYDVTDAKWRGIGAIPGSGLKLRPE